MLGFSFKKVFVGTAITGLFIGLILWLWQMQPQTPNQTVLSQKNESKQDNAAITKENKLEPEQNSIVKNSKIKLKGPTGNYQYLAIFSDDFSKIVKVKPNDSFESDITLVKGINILKLAGFGQQLKRTEEKTLSYYMDNSLSAKYAYAGSVKSLFDTLITLSTEDGEKSVRTGKTTDFAVPKDEDVDATAGSALKAVRIGDYAVALGDLAEKSKDTIFAQKLQIIRQDKPQITKKLVVSKVLTTPKNNSFSAQNLDDSKVLVFDLDKNTDIELDGKTVKASEIAKDKTAFIFYFQTEDENTIELMYLLP